MKNLFDGLFLYEIVLLVLGSLFFLVLLGGLISFFYRKQPVKWQYLLTFIIPAVMIAYPSIKKIEVEDGRILIEKLNQQFEESTETVVSSDDAKSSRKGVNQEEIKEQLAKQILEVEERPTTTEKSKIEIGKAYMNIGNEEKAEEIIEEVLIENPTNKKAVELKEKIAVKKLEVSK